MLSSVCDPPCRVDSSRPATACRCLAPCGWSLKLEQRAAHNAVRELSSTVDVLGVVEAIVGRRQFPNGLSHREGQVLGLVAVGKTNREIAASSSRSISKRPCAKRRASRRPADASPLSRGPHHERMQATAYLQALAPCCRRCQPRSIPSSDRTY
jgi:hypothetical protein